ncbi:MAG: hypothetical protein JOS17DRAFT_777379 [Linnemannia elongata]|nr:MAG: hypothetical protein JOS17DRAFT_777379 [Linnemannia elongata]
MMVAFFSSNVVVMLNVLIALVNHAIDDGDGTWEQDWLHNRMRYVESAENLTYNIPVFRAMFDYFPDTIYYTATPLHVREYKKKTQRIMEDKAISADLNIAAEFKVQQPISGNIGGAGTSGGIQDWQQSQLQQQQQSQQQQKQSQQQQEQSHIKPSTRPGPKHPVAEALNDYGILQLHLNESVYAVHHELLNVSAFEAAQQLVPQMELDTLQGLSHNRGVHPPAQRPSSHLDSSRGTYRPTTVHSATIAVSSTTKGAGVPTLVSSHSRALQPPCISSR